MENLVVYVVAGVLFLIFIGYIMKLFAYSAMTPSQRAAHDKAIVTRATGIINEHLICPHCQTKGTVRAKSVSRTETSTGKVGGIVKTNIKSRTTKQVTQHHCDKCGTTWDV